MPRSCVVAADPTTIFNLATFPGAPAGVFDAYVKQSLFPSCFANGLPASEARMLAATQEPLSTIALSQQTGSSSGAAWMMEYQETMPASPPSARARASIEPISNRRPGYALRARLIMAGDRSTRLKLPGVKNQPRQGPL